MKKIILLSAFLVTYVFMKAEDTLRVRVHNATDMTWNESYLDTAIFPSDTFSFRKIIMHYTMGCATGGCSSWDYTTVISAIDKNSESFELARVITPYGSTLNKTWKYTHTFDVTDFATILKDTVPIKAFYDGWTSGFSVTLDFEFIIGTPTRKVQKIENIYQGNWNYIIPVDFEATNLPEKKIVIDSAKSSRLRITPTGHGFVNSLNCAEFCEKNYYILVNGVTKFTQSMWRDDCGLNPIYPQNGTWLHDRANWCPGLEAHTYLHNLTPYYTVGDSFNLNMNIETYNYTVPVGETPAIYRIATQLVTYDDYNYNTEAELLNIIAPNSKVNYNRSNPICNSPIVEVLNNGENDIFKISFTYGIENDIVHTFEWTGTPIAFGEKLQISLPSIAFPRNSTSEEFYTTINSVNGVNDEFLENNTIKTNYIAPKEFDNEFILSLRTNKRGEETSYYLLNENGDTITTHKNLYKYQFSQTKLNNNTVFNDTLYLAGGCYELVLKDSEKNGLDFGAYNSEGAGYFIFLTKQETVLHALQPNFGSEIRYNFFVKENTGINSISNSILMVSPNPVHNNLNVQLDNFLGKNKLEIINALGQIVLIEKNVGKSTTVDVSKLAKGVYNLVITSEENIVSKKIIIE